MFLYLVEVALDQMAGALPEPLHATTEQDKIIDIVVHYSYLKYTCIVDSVACMATLKVL